MLAILNMCLVNLDSTEADLQRKEIKITIGYVNWCIHLAANKLYLKERKEIESIQR